MRTLGIVGGIGPESTIDYYRSIIAAYRERVRDLSYPHLLINSIDVKRMLGLVAEKAFDELTSYLTSALEQLARAGAELGLLAANTPHIVFDQLAKRSPIPLVSIVEATRDAALAGGLRRLALLGTRFTMTGGFYEKIFLPADIELVIPRIEEQTVIHDRYMEELVRGVFLPATRDSIATIIEAMKTRDAINGVILAGTELPLLFRDFGLGVPLLDTTQIHVRAAVAQML